MRMLAALLAVAGCSPAAAVSSLNLNDATMSRSGATVQPSALLSQADASAAVCVGEQHDDADHHRVQTQILEALIERADARGVKLALGMEMFRRRMQPALNAYFAREIDGAALRAATRWDETWGFDFAMYEPMLTLARDHGVRIVGLNAPRTITRAVARKGLAGLKPIVRESLPQLVLDDAGHRKFFWAVMGFDGEGHGHGAMSPENFYAAQVIWDETMAEGVSSWLSDPQPRQMMVVAGNGHCHASAIPKRVTRRTRSAVVSVLLESKGDELPAHTQSDFVIELNR